MKPYRILFLITAFLAILFLAPPSAPAMSLFGTRKKVEEKELKSFDNATTSSQEKLKRVIEGEKTPIRPIVPPANLTIRGDGNAILSMPEPHVAADPDREYQRYLDRKAYREQLEYEAGMNVAQKSDVKENSYESLKTSIPLGVGIILLAVGIFLMVWAVAAARKSSAAVDVAFTTADAGLANAIRYFRTISSTSTDPTVIAQAKTHEAELEAQRGKLVQQQP